MSDPAMHSDPASGTRDDRVVPFQIEGADVRGRLVRMGPAIDRALSGHGYPAPVSRLLGEALLVATLIGSGLKLRNRFTVQAQGQGAVSLLVADYRAGGEVRGYAGFDADAVAAAGPDADPFALLGGGFLAMTIDQGPDTEPYQGIVPIEGGSLAAAATRYFDQSEQIVTTMRLAVAEAFDRRAGGGAHWRGGGIMLQRLGKGGEEAKKALDTEEAAEDWARAGILLSSVEDVELIDPDLTPATLLYRLFHEDGVRVFEESEVAFGCTCSAEKVANVLRLHGQAELQDMVEDGEIRATCQFCSALYRFDPAEFLDR
ncbi:MAG: Hsp33 family molecular chaperone [Alphaproteobacteria bacterium]|nr:Hsp33 family molecular chaperone [Alphaproteobacteria bacterium]MDX5369990.1 Hsp33 family molecular chaperone [Alphaproteobacteria bacterium]MDX5464568.1 Hsp33 family molecular chaperone [Alphaproteobacteria bacterium]